MTECEFDCGTWFEIAQLLIVSVGFAMRSAAFHSMRTMKLTLAGESKE